MLNFLLNIFGCSHDWSRIWTLRPVGIARKGWPAIVGSPRTYQVCLTCGAERERNWEALGQLDITPEHIGEEAEEL